MGADRIVRATAGVVIVACVLILAGFAAFPRRASQYTAGLPLGVAHNSGDSRGATRKALAMGPTSSRRTTLYAGHDPPLPLIGRRFFRGPKLEEIWLEADAAEAIKLDLKESTPS